MIKYLGSKRVLVPVLGDIAAAVGAHTAVAAGTRLYELALPYFQAIDASVKRNGSRT